MAVAVDDPMDEDEAAVSCAAETNADEGEEEVDADEELEEEGFTSQKWVCASH